MDVATGQIKDSEVTQILSEAIGIPLRQARKYKKLAKKGSAEVLDAFEKKEISMADAEFPVIPNLNRQNFWKNTEIFPMVRNQRKSKKMEGKLAIWQVRTRSLQLMKRL